MFLKYIKELLNKKKVKKRLSNVKIDASNIIIKTVGILIDESYFFDTDTLVEDLIAKGIIKEDIQILVFKDKVKKSEVVFYPTFSYNDLNRNESFDNPDVINFINKKFDLLINYYDVEKAPLLLVSHLSTASFKTGFSSIDKRLNHFMINTNVENHKIFIEELFIYLKILNKL